MTLVAILLLVLVACESKTTGRRVALPDVGSEAAPEPQAESGGITAAAVADTTTGQTAAEALKDLQSSDSPVTSSGAKSGNFYPPASSDATYEEALKERTRALFQQNTYDPNVEADDEFGARYHDSDGDLKNLPDEYDDSKGD